MKGIQITPIALLVVNTISMSSAYADIPVTCHTTGTSESDLFCGSVSNTNGAVKVWRSETMRLFQKPLFLVKRELNRLLL